MCHTAICNLFKPFLPFRSTYNSQFGFTLVELIIVLVIVGILSSIAVTSYHLHISKAQSNACL